VASTRRFDETVVANLIKVLLRVFANQGLIKVSCRLHVRLHRCCQIFDYFAALAERDDGTANSPQVLESRGVEPARLSSSITCSRLTA
jgi:hypothetical protein